MSVRRSFLLLAIAVTAGGVTMTVTYGARDGLLAAVLLGLLGSPVLALTHIFARRRGRAGSLSRQFVAGVGLVVGAALLGVGVVASVLFVSSHDAFTMALLLAFAGALSAHSAWLLANAVMRDIRKVRDGIRAIGEGDHTPAMDTTPGDEIAELAGVVEHMRRQLADREAERDAAEAARRRLIASISHDLRTPLTSLQLVSRAVEDGLVNEDTGRRYLEQIPPLVRSLDDLIEDLFELSRLEAGEISWALEPLELREVIDESIRAMQLQADHASIALRARPSEGLCMVLGNSDKLQRVLRNLIQNAVRHTPPDGTITVGARSGVDGAEVEVADTGSGVQADERDQLFDAFFRGIAEVSRSGRGAGLGLTICRAIVEAHGGRIWLAESAQGTRILFSLRSAQPDDARFGLPAHERSLPGAGRG